MSSLRSVCTAIAALTVSYTKEATGTVTVTNYDVDAAPNQILAADLPARLIGVARGSTSSNFARRTATQTDVETTHSGRELALIEKIGLSRTRDEWADVMRYVDAFLAVMVSNRDIVAKCQISSVNSNRAVYEYPANSGDYFYGAQTDITILETG